MSKRPCPVILGAAAIGAVSLVGALLARSSSKPVAKRVASGGDNVSPPAPSPPNWRERLVDQALSYVGVLYQWGGGHSAGTWGVDCSGLVIESLRGIGLPLPPGTATSGAWWASLPRVETPQAGDLAFYGSDGVAHHVVVVSGFDPSTGLASVVSANGDRTDTSPDVAEAAGHRVKTYDTHLYRSDFLGFSSLAEVASGVHRNKVVNLDLPLVCMMTATPGAPAASGDEACGC